MFGGAVEPGTDAALDGGGGERLQPAAPGGGGDRAAGTVARGDGVGLAFVHGLAHLALDRQLAGDLDRDRLIDVGTRIFGTGLVAAEVLEIACAFAAWCAPEPAGCIQRRQRSAARFRGPRTTEAGQWSG